MTNRSYAYSRLNNAEDSFNSSKTVRKEPSYDDESDQSTKLRKLHPSHSSKKERRIPGAASHSPSYSSSDSVREYIEHVIQPQETLQGLALLYRCSIFELKLSNSIQKDTEFFARRTLRIPVRQYSFLTEKVQNNTVSDLIPPLNSSVTDNGATTSHLNGASNPTASSTQFLQQVDQDLLRLKEKARVYDITIPSSATSDVVRLRQSAGRGGRSSDCSGDDCGLSWTHIFGIALLVLLACPLLYFLYLELNLHRTLHNETASIAPTDIHDDTDAALINPLSNNIS